MNKKVKDKINNYRRFKSTNAITLISLVITIIVLIILASVAVNLSLGNNGIFTRVKQAKEKYSEASAREKLELALANIRIEKETNKEYNKEKFIDNMLEEKDISVNGDEVIVDNYIFIIDRERLIISKSLGESYIKITKKVTNYMGKNENGKYEVELLIIIESNNEIESAVIERPDKTTLKIETDKLKLEKDITIELDEEYKVIVTAKDGKIEERKIVERSEETIRTAEELVEFRDKVNRGLTYEGKIIKLGNNIDLSKVCGKDIDGEEISWEPVGNYEKKYMFRGIFDGQYNSILNIYINDSSQFQGFFGYNGGTIKNLRVDSGKIRIGENSSSIVAINSGEIFNCMNCVNIEANNYGVGGIVGESNNGIIKNCINKGNITTYANSGGICRIC